MKCYDKATGEKCYHARVWLDNRGHCRVFCDDKFVCNYVTANVEVLCRYGKVERNPKTLAEIMKEV